MNKPMKLWYFVVGIGIVLIAMFIRTQMILNALAEIPGQESEWLTMRALAIIYFLMLPMPVYADVQVNATGSCEMWLKAGKNKVFRQIQEAFVLGLLEIMF